MQASFDAYSINENESESSMSSKTDRYFRYVYDQIKFPNKKLNFDAFSKAYYGYLNLIEEGKLRPGALLTVCDFNLSSNQKRMWVIDLKNKKILFNTLVAHGQGTGEEYAEAFSNTPDSHQSSLGFYLTGETYEGNNGNSLKLLGVDGSFNSNAYDRAIVIHGAEYVCNEYARANKRIGRSHGCPALPVEVAPKVIDKIKNGHCLFIYHSSKQYFASSHWINSRLKSLPEEANRMDLKMPVKNNPRYVASASEINSSTPMTEVSNQACTKDNNSDECQDMVSGGDKQNYKVEVKTILIKKADLPKKELNNTEKISATSTSK